MCECVLSRREQASVHGADNSSTCLACHLPCVRKVCWIKHDDGCCYAHKQSASLHHGVYLSVALAVWQFNLSAAVCWQCWQCQQCWQRAPWAQRFERYHATPSHGKQCEQGGAFEGARGAAGGARECR